MTRTSGPPPGREQGQPAPTPRPRPSALQPTPPSPTAYQQLLFEPGSGDRRQDTSAGDRAARTPPSREPLSSGLVSPPRPSSSQANPPSRTAHHPLLIPENAGERREDTAAGPTFSPSPATTPVRPEGRSHPQGLFGRMTERVRSLRDDAVQRAREGAFQANIARLGQNLPILPGTGLRSELTFEQFSQWARRTIDFRNSRNPELLRLRGLMAGAYTNEHGELICKFERQVGATGLPYFSSRDLPAGLPSGLTIDGTWFHLNPSGPPSSIDITNMPERLTVTEVALFGGHLHRFPAGLRVQTSVTLSRVQGLRHLEGVEVRGNAVFSKNFPSRLPESSQVRGCITLQREDFDTIQHLHATTAEDQLTEMLPTLQRLYRDRVMILDRPGGEASLPTNIRFLAPGESLPVEPATDRAPPTSAAGQALDRPRQGTVQRDRRTPPRSTSMPAFKNLRPLRLQLEAFRDATCPITLENLGDIPELVAWDRHGAWWAPTTAQWRSTGTLLAPTR